MAYRGVPARGYPIGPDNRRRPGRTGFSPFSRSTRFPFTYRFAARAPCDSKGSECQCGIHTAEAASALRSRKTERAAKEKPTPISHFFLAPAAPGHPNSPPRPGEAPHPAPSARKSVIRLHRKLPSVPPASITLNLGVGCAPSCWPIFGFRNLLGARCTTRCTTRCTARPIAALHFLPPV